MITKVWKTPTVQQFDSGHRNLPVYFKQTWDKADQHVELNMLRRDRADVELLAWLKETCFFFCLFCFVLFCFNCACWALSKDGAVPVAAYCSNSWYFIVFIVFLACFFCLLFVLCAVDKHYPHTKMLFQQFGYLLVPFFMLWSLLVTGSRACCTAGNVYNRDLLIALRLQTDSTEGAKEEKTLLFPVIFPVPVISSDSCIPAVITGNVRSLANKID